MGREAKNIFTSLHLANADKKKCRQDKNKKDKFDKNFMIKRHVIYNRVKFITTLQLLSEICSLGSMQYEK